jgi:hypothetical protein
VAARASAELGRCVPFAGVASTLTKLGATDGLLEQYHERRGNDKRRRYYRPTFDGRELAATLGCPHADRPGAPSALGCLPAELVLQVLLRLPLDARARCACVSAAWRALADSPALWREVSCRDAGAWSHGPCTPARARGAVARAGRALLRLDTGLCVLHEDEVHELLCEQRCCPALETLTLGGTCAARDEEDALDVVTGHAILRACPALRELHCSVESDRRLQTETRPQHDACLAELAAFLSHAAVRCASLVIPRFTLAADTPAARDALAAALAAQAGCLQRLFVCCCADWLLELLAAALPRLTSLTALHFACGLPTACAAALGHLTRLGRLRADVVEFEDGALPALAAFLQSPGCALHSLTITPLSGADDHDAAPLYDPPAAADVGALAMALHARLRAGGGPHEVLRYVYFETHLNDGTGARQPLLCGGSQAADGFAALLRDGLAHLRIGPVDAAAATQLVTAAGAPAACVHNLVLSLLDERAASAAAYAARALLLLAPAESRRVAHPFMGLMLDDAAISAAASLDLAATLRERMDERFHYDGSNARGGAVSLVATLSEPTDTRVGPVSCAFARAYARSVRDLHGPAIRSLELTFAGSHAWSDEAALEWSAAFVAAAEDELLFDSRQTAEHTGVKLRWLDVQEVHAACPLCHTPEGAALLQAADDLAQVSAGWRQPVSVRVCCRGCVQCSLRCPDDAADEDEDDDEEEEEEEEEGDEEH